MFFKNKLKAKDNKSLFINNCMWYINDYEKKNCNEQKAYPYWDICKNEIISMVKKFVDDTEDKVFLENSPQVVDYTYFSLTFLYNQLSEMLCSGKHYHIFRGKLNDTGIIVLSFVKYCMNLLVEKGDFTKEQGVEEIKIIEREIQNVG